jgi:hypothetical protein
MKAGTFALEGGWFLAMVVDDDNHLNVYVSNNDDSQIHSIESGQGDGSPGEQLGLRFTTDDIEQEYINSSEVAEV